MLTSTFILVLNNGESYEDFNHWNAGIFKSIEEAKTFADSSGHSHNGYNVEEWNLKGLVKTHEFYQ